MYFLNTEGGGVRQMMTIADERGGGGSLELPKFG